MIFAEKRVENFARGNVATKSSSFVHEINHSRARVMDESGRRKRGNTSGSLKRSWSQQGWRERVGRSSNKDAVRNFSFTAGWKIDGGVWLAWKITEEIPRDSRRGAADRPFQNLWSRLPLFHRIFIRPSIRVFRTPRPTYPGEQNASSSSLLFLPSSGWERKRVGVKRALVASDRIVYSGIVKTGGEKWRKIGGQ